MLSSSILVELEHLDWQGSIASAVLVLSLEEWEAVLEEVRWVLADNQVLNLEEA